MALYLVIVQRTGVDKQMARIIQDIFSKTYGHITTTWNDNDTFTVVQDRKNRILEEWTYQSEKLARAKVRQLYPVPVDEGTEQMEKACAAMDEANNRFYDSVY